MPRITFLLIIAVCGLVLIELPLAAHAGEGHGAPWWGLVLLGRFHVLVVHFPIALIVLIGLIEAWRWWRRDQTPNSLLLPLSILTALSALIAAGMGWLQASSMGAAGREAELILVHRWTGTVTAVVAAVMVITCWRLARASTPLRAIIHRSTLAVGVILVSITGHVGGLMVHGEDYLSSALPWAQVQMPAEKPMSPMTPTPNQTNALPTDDHRGNTEGPAAEPVAFARDIAPVLAASCLECHGPDKQKGDLRVDGRPYLLSGGATGAAIIPGRGDESLLIQRLRGLGGDPRMPKKKDPIPEATIRIIVRWIDEGAAWPAGAPLAAP